MSNGATGQEGQGAAGAGQQGQAGTQDPSQQGAAAAGAAGQGGEGAGAQQGSAAPGGGGPAATPGAGTGQAAQQGSGAAQGSGAGQQQGVQEGGAPKDGYGDFTYPKGTDHLISDDRLASFKELIAKFGAGKGLSQEDAQALVDWQGEYYATLVRDAEAERAGWKEAAQQHPIYGGSKFEQSESNIEALFAQLDSEFAKAAAAEGKKPEKGLGAWLKETGYLYHGPVFAALAHMAGQLVGEPGGPRGGAVPQPPTVDLDSPRGRAKAWGFDKTQSS